MNSMAGIFLSASMPFLPFGDANAAITDDALRFAAARSSLQDLDSVWDNKVGNDGDAIRRVLGTVFTPPRCSVPLCGFEKFGRDFLISHFDEISDADAFDTELGKTNDYLNQADFLAYSSIFSEYGNGGGGKDYIAESRVQVKKAIESLDALQNLIPK